MNNSNEFDGPSNIIKNTAPQTLKYNEKTGKATKPSHLSGAADSADRIKDESQTLTPAQTTITDRQIAHAAPNEAEVSQMLLPPNTETSNKPSVATKEAVNDSPTRPENSGDTAPPDDRSGKHSDFKINNVNLVSPRLPLKDHFVSDAEQSDQNHLKLEKEGGAHRHDIVAPLGDQSPLASNTSFIELPRHHQSLPAEPSVEAPHAETGGVAAHHQTDHPETPLSAKTTVSLSATAMQHLQTEQQTTQELNKTIQALASRIQQRKSNH